MMSVWMQPEWGHIMLCYGKNLNGRFVCEFIDKKIETALFPSEWGYVYIGEFE